MSYRTRKAATPRQRVEGAIYREIQISPDAIVDPENRVVKVSFSSEQPVERFDIFDMEPWIEILGHDADELDLSRLNRRATVHYNHMRSREDRLGAVVQAWINKKRGEAELQISKREDVEGIWQDIRDGLLTNISVGYVINERVLVKQSDDAPDEYRVTSWTPIEISFVDIPADPTVGMGRSEPRIEHRVIDLNPTQPQQQRAEPMDELTKQQAQRFGKALDAKIRAATTQDRDRGAIIEAVAQATGNEAEAIERMIAGEIECPARERLADFAEALGTETADLESAIEGGASRSDTEPGNRGDNAMSEAEKRELERKAQREARQAEQTRIRDVRNLVSKHRNTLGEETAKKIEDRAIDGDDNGEVPNVGQVRDWILDELGKAAAPAGGSALDVTAGESARDKLITGATRAIEFRVGLVKRDSKVQQEARENPYAGLRLSELARECLRAAGQDTRGEMMEVVGRAFTSSDFPQILADVANKAALKGYSEAPETWSLWAATMSLSDFKTQKVVGLSAFDDLSEIGEDGEYRYGTFEDRGEEITLASYGKIFGISRQAVVNDDLSILGRIPMGMGRAAARTIGNIVYAQLTGNPTLNDGNTLFDSANHSNDQSGEVPGVDSLLKMRRNMKTQKGEGDRTAALNIQPGFVLSPVAQEDTLRQAITSQYDPRTSVNDRSPNPAQNVGELVAEPRLDDDSTTRHYMAGTSDFDTIAVGFLDGNQEPRIEQQNAWSRDGTEFRVTLDAGAAPMDYKALQRHSGTV